MKKCLDCAKEIASRSLRCNPCHGKALRGIPRPEKGAGQSLPLCRDCNTILGDPRSIKCRKCASFQKGIGKKLSEEHKMKIREATKITWSSLELRQRNSEIQKGEKHWNWRGGKTSPNEMVRKSLHYRLWREAVLKRDNYTCQGEGCGAQSVPGAFVLMHADHIKPFALFPELRFAIDNGRTLCVPCHKQTPTYLNPKMKKEDFIC